MMVYAVDIGGDLDAFLGTAAAVALKVVIFLVIMGLGWLVARWLYRLLARFLARIGFDTAAQRGGLNRLIGDNRASDLTAKLVMFGFLLFVLQLAFGVFGPNPVSDLIRNVVAWLPSLFVAVVIIVVAAGIAGWANTVVSGALGGLSYGRTVAALVQMVILVLGVVGALNQLGIAMTVIMPVLIAVLATLAGVVIVGVGGGLVKPMQHRWERILNRAEMESILAAENIRRHRELTATGRPLGQEASRGFGQPAYRGTAPTDTKLRPEQPTPTTPTAPTAPAGTSPEPAPRERPAGGGSHRSPDQP